MPPRQASEQTAFVFESLRSAVFQNIAEIPAVQQLFGRQRFIPFIFRYHEIFSNTVAPVSCNAHRTGKPVCLRIVVEGIDVGIVDDKAEAFFAPFTPALAFHLFGDVRDGRICEHFLRIGINDAFCARPDPYDTSIRLSVSRPLFDRPACFEVILDQRGHRRNLKRFLPNILACHLIKLVFGDSENLAAPSAHIYGLKRRLDPEDPDPVRHRVDNIAQISLGAGRPFLSTDPVVHVEQRPDHPDRRAVVVKYLDRRHLRPPVAAVRHFEPDRDLSMLVLRRTPAELFHDRSIIRINTAVAAPVVQDILIRERAHHIFLIIRRRKKCPLGKFPVKHCESDLFDDDSIPVLILLLAVPLLDLRRYIRKCTQYQRLIQGSRIRIDLKRAGRSMNSRSASVKPPFEMNQLFSAFKLPDIVDKSGLFVLRDAVEESRRCRLHDAFFIKSEHRTEMAIHKPELRIVFQRIDRYPAWQIII